MQISLNHGKKILQKFQNSIATKDDDSKSLADGSKQQQKTKKATIKKQPTGDATSSTQKQPKAQSKDEGLLKRF